MRDKILCLAFILILFTFGLIIELFIKNVRSNEVLISVTVKGAVIKQGVYFCHYGVSVSEVLEKCGGMTELGYLPDNFDYHSPITNDTIINIPKRYSTVRKNYEEN